MIINSRKPFESQEQTPDEIYEACLVRIFHKPLELLRAEVKAAEEYDLAQPIEIVDNWE